ncbi:hypothetical protein BDQ12DRAFT_736777 [Crucibulum laeve]|uniref:DUF7918 domain-containing protein n=1 Tax=Crucibulum laeve TaxID=68775 RepID=A0A5C3LV49_9AGAR|nr:hypothetical protein BDQ12DRAFT_736777 [Crucibulum laeve]
MLKLNGFEAWIKVDNKKVPKYNVKTDRGEQIVTCWIPSEVGKVFSVNWENLEHTSWDTSVDVLLDGIDAEGMVIRQNHLTSAGNFTGRMRDILTSPTTVRPFLFSPLQLTDDDAYLDKASPAQLSEIQLKIYKTKINSREYTSKVYPVLNSHIVHERSKKATAHQVGPRFGEEEYVPKRRHIKTKDLNRIATCVFKYQSRGSSNSIRLTTQLESQPTAGSSSRVVAKRKASAIDVKEVDDDEEGEGDAVMKKLKALQVHVEELRKLVKVRARIIKKPKVGKRPVFLPGEIIDLA